LNLVWRWSEKFPGSVPVTLFKEYIARVQFDTDYYYTRIPRNDERREVAHIVQSSLDHLGLLAEQCNPQQFADAYLRFVLQVQAHLGETGEPPSPDREDIHAQQKRQRLRTDDPLAHHRR